MQSATAEKHLSRKKKKQCKVIDKERAFKGNIQLTKKSLNIY